MKRFILSLFFLVCLAIGIYWVQPDKENASFGEVLFADSNRERVLLWDEFPGSVAFLGDANSDLIYRSQQVIAEINEIAGANILTQQENRATRIYLIFSQQENSTFEIEYRRIFLERFGEEETRFYEKQGAFEFKFSPVHPCFGFGLTEPDKFRIEGYAANNPPDFYVINIGNISRMSPVMIGHCLREELAHAAFFIPDFVVSSGEESIFNANQVLNARADFSSFDRKLMQFLTNNREVSGMTRFEFESFAE